MQHHADALDLPEITAALPAITTESQVDALLELCSYGAQSVSQMLENYEVRLAGIGEQVALTGEEGTPRAGYEVETSVRQLEFVDQREPAVELDMTQIAAGFTGNVVMKNVTISRDLSLLYSTFTLVAVYPAGSLPCVLGTPTPIDAGCMLAQGRGYFGDVVLGGFDSDYVDAQLEAARSVKVNSSEADAYVAELRQPIALGLTHASDSRDPLLLDPACTFLEGDEVEVLTAVPAAMADVLCRS